jgi:hypothetical protein
MIQKARVVVGDSGGDCLDEDRIDRETTACQLLQQAVSLGRGICS